MHYLCADVEGELKQSMAFGTIERVEDKQAGCLRCDFSHAKVEVCCASIDEAGGGQLHCESSARIRSFHVADTSSGPIQSQENAGLGQFRGL